MYRLFCDPKDIAGDKIYISDSSQIHHIKDVLRHKVGDKIGVSDKQGNIYLSVIEKLTAKNMLLRICPKTDPRGDKDKSLAFEKQIKITAACAIPKKAKFDDIVDKLTQLGVERIIPLDTQRVIARLDKDKKISRLLRWKKIALSAAKQSQRLNLPIIDAVTDIKELFSKEKNFDLKLIPNLIDGSAALREIFVNNQKAVNSVLILIGPEGDFTADEIAAAKEAGCIPVSLGKLILRVDTAVIAVTSFIRFFTV